MLHLQSWTISDRFFGGNPVPVAVTADPKVGHDGRDPKHNDEDLQDQNDPEPTGEHG